jgi:hypothetical protein
MVTDADRAALPGEMTSGVDFHAARLTEVDATSALIE